MLLVNANLDSTDITHVYISSIIMKFKSNVIEYKVYQKISNGSYGQVYKTYCSYNKNTVAMKVTNIIQHANGNEINNILSITQDKKYTKYIPKFYHIFYNDKSFCTVMEYLDGFHYNNNYFYNNITNIWQAIKLSKKILKIIDYFHTNNYVLNDLKWDNIIIDKKRNPKFIDFGLMHPVDYELNYSLGAVLYVPPEAYKQINSKTKKDMWTFGIMSYQFFVGGDCPFERLISLTNDPTKINNYEFNVDNFQSTLNGMKYLFTFKMANKFGHGKIIHKNIDKLWKMIYDCLNVQFDNRPSAKQILKEYL